MNVYYTECTVWGINRLNTPEQQNKNVDNSDIELNCMGFFFKEKPPK